MRLLAISCFLNCQTFPPILLFSMGILKVRIKNKQIQYKRDEKIVVGLDLGVGTGTSDVPHRPGRQHCSITRLIHDITRRPMAS